jgi:futalosine hydrolase
MGKQILVLAATMQEIEPFITIVRSNQGILNGHSIGIMISGIGLTSTTYQLTKQLSIKRPDLMIQAGLAGSFDPNIVLGSVVIVKQDRIADEAVVENMKLSSIYDLGLRSPDAFPYKKQWLTYKFKMQGMLQFPEVKGISVNQITTDEQMIKMLRIKYKPVVESMEGAALHFVGLAEKVPFIQLRAVSNYIGERNKKHWKMKESIQNLNEAIIEIIKNY